MDRVGVDGDQVMYSDSCMFRLRYWDGACEYADTGGVRAGADSFKGCVNMSERVGGLCGEWNPIHVFVLRRKSTGSERVPLRVCSVVDVVFQSLA